MMLTRFSCHVLIITHLQIYTLTACCIATIASFISDQHSIWTRSLLKPGFNNILQKYLCTHIHCTFGIKNTNAIVYMLLCVCTFSFSRIVISVLMLTSQAWDLKYHMWTCLLCNQCAIRAWRFLPTNFYRVSLQSNLNIFCIKTYLHLSFLVSLCVANASMLNS